MGGGLHAAMNNPFSGVSSLERSTTCDIEVQDTVMNHPCNVKFDNLGLGQGR
jgi:hypothetical protein